MPNPGPIARPYITSTDGIARADRTRLADKKDQQIYPRRVEDPVKLNERIRKVRHSECLPLFSL